MAKWVHSDVLDGGLNAIKNNANSMRLLVAYAAADSYATVVANTVGGCTASMASGDYTLAGSGSNRTLTTASGKTANATANTQQYDAGTATAGGASTLTDSSKSWTTNQHANRAVTITSGTGSGQARVISSNTGTVLTVSAAWTTQPDSTSVYRISDDLHVAFVDTVNSKVLWVTDEVSNQAITSGNGVTFPSLVYTAQQPT